jgi:hypothetical protein
MKIKYQALLTFLKRHPKICMLVRKLDKQPSRLVFAVLEDIASEGKVEAASIYPLHKS